MVCVGGTQPDETFKNKSAIKICCYNGNLKEKPHQIYNGVGFSVKLCSFYCSLKIRLQRESGG